MPPALLNWLPILAAILSSTIVGLINVWVNYKNRVYGARKDHMTRGLFVVNRVVSMHGNPTSGDDFSSALDEIKTIFYLYGTDREREIEREIAMALNNPYATGPQKLDSERSEKVYGLVAQLTAEIRKDLTEKASWI